MIATGTNPWIEVDGKPVVWEAGPSCNPDCDSCGSVLPGVIECMDTPEGIQRCDQCDTYEGDIEAAQALAAAIGGGVVVWEEEAE